MPDEKLPITPVSNYRQLSQAELHLMNEAVALEEQFLAFHDKLQEMRSFSRNWDRATHPHPRWLAIGKTHIEQGFMALRRAIAKPGRDQQEVLNMGGAKSD